MAKTPVKRKRAKVGDPPLPNSCELTDLCEEIRTLIETIGNAPSGSFLSIEDGVLTVLAPPSPLTANLIAVLDHTTGQWSFATAP